MIWDQEDFTRWHLRIDLKYKFNMSTQRIYGDGIEGSRNGISKDLPFLEHYKHIDMAKA